MASDARYTGAMIVTYRGYDRGLDATLTETVRYAPSTTVAQIARNIQIREGYGFWRAVSITQELSAYEDGVVDGN
jgi:hypothetical protein